MKQLTILIALFVLVLSTNSAMSQDGGPALASVTYEFIHVIDTNDRNNPIRENMVLRLGEGGSKYTSEKTEEVLRKARAQAKAAAEGATGGPTVVASGRPMVTVYGPGYTNEELFQLTKEKSLIKTANLGRQSYSIETPLPVIDWKIGKETRKIGAYTCQNATGMYAGRTYTAWFTTDLPFRNGPWKLSGLPGLILEAKDSKNEVLFLFKEISKDTTEGLRITSDRRGLIKVSEEAYTRAKTAFDEDPVAGMQSQLSPNAPPVSVAYRDSTGKSVTGDAARAMIEKQQKEAKTKNNNPLELKGK